MNDINFITKEMLLYTNEDTEQERERKKTLRIKILNILLFSRTNSTLSEREKKENGYYNHMQRRVKYRNAVAAHKKLRTLDVLNWKMDPFLFGKFYIKECNDDLGYISNTFVLLEFMAILDKLLDIDVDVSFKKRSRSSLLESAPMQAVFG